MPFGISAQPLCSLRVVSSRFQFGQHDALVFTAAWTWGGCLTEVQSQSPSHTHWVTHADPLQVQSWARGCISASGTMSYILVLRMTTSLPFSLSYPPPSWVELYFITCSQKSPNLFSYNLKNKNIPFLSWNKNFNSNFWEQCVGEHNVLIKQLPILSSLFLIPRKPQEVVTTGNATPLEEVWSVRYLWQVPCLNPSGLHMHTPVDPARAFVGIYVTDNLLYGCRKKEVYTYNHTGAKKTQ